MAPRGKALWTSVYGPCDIAVTHRGPCLKFLGSVSGDLPRPVLCSSCVIEFLVSMCINGIVILPPVNSGSFVS